MFFRGRSVNEILRAPDGDPGAGAFPAEYVKTLRDEAKDNRLRATEAEGKLVTAQAAATAAEAVLAREREEHAAALQTAQTERETALAAAQADAAARVEATRTETTTAVQMAANTRIITAELKAAAIKTGMVDVDGLKLLDTSKVVLGDDGEVKIPDGFFEEAKKARPYLFGAAGTSTSGTADPPKPGPGGAKQAAEMTPEERKAGLRALGVKV